MTTPILTPVTPIPRTNTKLSLDDSYTSRISTSMMTTPILTTVTTVTTLPRATFAHNFAEIAVVCFIGQTNV